MQITIEPTEEFFVTDDGTPMRAWRGTTGNGTRVVAFVAAIAAAASDDQAELETELMEIPGPPMLAFACETTEAGGSVRE